MDNQLTPTPDQIKELSWFSGILDGEGTFMINYINTKRNRKKKVSLAIRMGNTDKAILAEYIRILDKYRIKHWIYTQQAEKKHKIATIVVVQRLTHINKLCDLIHDYLVGKRDQCYLLSKFVKARIKRTGLKYNAEYSQDEHFIIEQIKDKNMKGVRDCTVS